MSEFEWEKLSSQRDNNYWFMTHRAKVPGGYLYRTFDMTHTPHVKSTSESMVFVPESKVENDLLPLIKKLRDRLDVVEKQIEDLEMKLAVHIQNRGCEIPLPLPPKVKCLHDWDFSEGVCKVCGAQWRFFMAQPCNTGDTL